MDSSKGKESKMATYEVKVASLLDLARNVCISISSPIFYALKYGNKYRLIVIGEKICGASVLYFFETDKIAKFCIYSPIGKQEMLELKDEISSDYHNYKTYKIQIVELLKNPFGSKSKEKKGKKLVLFEVKDYESIIRNSLSIAAEEEKMGKIYSFKYKNKRYVCSLMNIDDESTALFYAKVKSTELFNFIRYNYSRNKIESLKSLESMTYAPVAVINLAEPFPFFKPE